MKAPRREERSGHPTHRRGSLRRSSRIARLSLLIALASAWLGGCVLPPGNDNDNTPAGTPSAQLVFQNLRTSLMSVSGTSADDVYAVGGDLGAGDGPNVLHFDGERWRRMPTGIAAGDLWWISVNPVDGRFLVAGAPGLIARFDPETGGFEQFETPGDENLFGVWAADATTAFAVGGDLGNLNGGGVIWRYDGESWSVEDTGELGAAGLPLLYKVWGRSADDVYVVGRAGTLLHYDGSSWSRLPAGTSRTLLTIHGAGSRVCAVGGIGDGVVVEKNNGGFSDRTPAGAVQLSGVYMEPDGSGAAVGRDGTLLLRDPAGWTATPIEFDTLREWHGVWIDPDGGVWTVGGDLSADLDEGIVGYYGLRTIPDTVAR